MNTARSTLGSGVRGMGYAADRPGSFSLPPPRSPPRFRRWIKGGRASGAPIQLPDWRIAGAARFTCRVFCGVPVSETGSRRARPSRGRMKIRRASRARVRPGWRAGLHPPAPPARVRPRVGVAMELTALARRLERKSRAPRTLNAPAVASLGDSPSARGAARPSCRRGGGEDAQRRRRQG